MSHPVVAVEGKAIVILNAVEDTSPGGLFIVEDAREKSTEATVVSSGVDDVFAGDKVLLSGPYAGAAYKVDGVDYITVVGEEILAVIG